MRDWIRLDLKANRFELVAVAVALLLLTGALVVSAIFLNAQHDAFPHCFGPEAPGGPDCPSAIDGLIGMDQVAEWLLRLAWISPIITVVLGAPIVAREIESGTAQLTWAFTTSRAKWLAARCIPIGLVAVGLLGLVGSGAELLTSARLAGADPGFNAIDQRGLIVPARGLLAFVLAIAIGTTTGRVLPALLLSVPAFVIALLAVTLALGPWRVADSTVEPFGQGGVRPGALIIEPVAILSDGTIVPEDQTDRIPQDSYVDAVRLLPAEAATIWAARESAALLLLTVAIGVLAFIAVRQRRPLL